MKKYLSKQSVKYGFTILKAAINGFMNDLALKYSASLAFYTVFSLAPLLLLTISLAGIFLGRDAIQGKVFAEINGFVGNDAAKQVQDMIKHLQMSGKSTVSVVIGVITLVIGATSVFGEIQESVNIIWQVRTKPKRAWLKLITDRLLSGSLIVALGFLLLVSLLINGALLAVSDHLKTFVPGITVIVFNLLNIVVSFFVITLLQRNFQGASGCETRLAGRSFRRYIYSGTFYAGQAGDRSICKYVGNELHLWCGWVSNRFIIVGLLYCCYPLFWRGIH
jgi:membrane protein